MAAINFLSDNYAATAQLSCGVQLFLGFIIARRGAYWHAGRPACIL